MSDMCKTPSCTQSNPELIKFTRSEKTQRTIPTDFPDGYIISGVNWNQPLAHKMLKAMQNLEIFDVSKTHLIRVGDRRVGQNNWQHSRTSKKLSIGQQQLRLKVRSLNQLIWTDMDSSHGISHSSEVTVPYASMYHISGAHAIQTFVCPRIFTPYFGWKGRMARMCRDVCNITSTP